MYDAVVVGGGPAGLAAATWLARYRRSVVVIDGGEQRNRWVETTHGYFSRDAASPASLLDDACTELLAYPTAELKHARVTAATVDGGARFVVDTDAGQLTARRLVLATGVVDAFPDVEGFFDHYGTSVFHCPTCDGYEARRLHVVVFGWTEEVAGFALNLLEWAASVTLVTDGARFEGDEVCRLALDRHGVAVLEDDAEALIGSRGDLKGVRLRGGTTVECQRAFFSIAHHPRTELATALGCALTEEGCIAVDEHGRTTVEGVYAAGDVTPGLQLVQVAAAKGAVAGVQCALSIQGEPAVETAPAPGPDPEAELERARDDRRQDG